MLDTKPEKLYGNPGADPVIAKILEDSFAKGSTLNNDRVRMAVDEQDRIIRDAIELFERLSIKSQKKASLADQGLQSQIQAQNNVIAKYAPPSAADVEAFQKKNLSLQEIGNESPTSGEGATPCIIFGEFPENHWGKFMFSGSMIEIDKTKNMRSKEDALDFVHNNKDASSFIVRLEKIDQPGSFVSTRVKGASMDSFMERLQNSGISVDEGRTTITPCKRILIDKSHIESMTGIWAQVARSGQADQIEKCPDIYHPDDTKKMGSHFLNANISTSKMTGEEVAGKFTSGAESLELLIGPSIDRIMKLENIRIPIISLRERDRSATDLEYSSPSM